MLRTAIQKGKGQGMLIQSCLRQTSDSLVYNHRCILLAFPDQSVEKIGIMSFRLMERDRAVDLQLRWTAGIAAPFPQAASSVTASCPKAAADACCSAQVPLARGLIEGAVWRGDAWQQAGGGQGICSSSQFISFFLTANAGAPLAVHEGPAAQGPDSVKHRVCDGFTSFHLGDEPQAALEVGADGVEAPAELGIAAVLVGPAGVVTNVQLVAALGHGRDAQI